MPQRVTADAALSPPPITVVQVGSFGSIGDNIYRVHEPAAAMAQVPGVQMFEVHPLSRHCQAAALAADVLVLTMTLDIEALNWIAQRRALGKPTVCEVNDYLPDVQPWNPAHATWSDKRALRLFEALIRQSDAVQVTSPALAQRVASWARQVAVFPNQLVRVPPPRTFQQTPADTPVVVGWGGSLGHFKDLQHIVPALTAWLHRQPQARLEIMGDHSMAALFQGLSPAQFRFHQAGSLAGYLQWLEGLDIGLAPLLPTPYNRCRSDVKFLEYASRGVVPVMQRLEPYSDVLHGQTGFLWGEPHELVSLLDALVASAPLRIRVAQRAHAHVSAERTLGQHIHHRIDFYRAQLARAAQAASTAGTAHPAQPLPEALLRAGEVSPTSLPGWQPLGPRHLRMDLTSPAELHRAAGVDAMQLADTEAALAAFLAAVRCDPTDADALSWLGICLKKQGRTHLATQAWQRAAALNPLLSRPLRALHRMDKSPHIPFNMALTKCR